MHCCLALITGDWMCHVGWYCWLESDVSLIIWFHLVLSSTEQLCFCKLALHQFVNSLCVWPASCSRCTATHIVFCLQFWLTSYITYYAYMSFFKCCHVLTARNSSVWVLMRTRTVGLPHLFGLEHPSACLLPFSGSYLSIIFNADDDVTALVTPHFAVWH